VAQDGKTQDRDPDLTPQDQPGHDPGQLVQRRQRDQSGTNQDLVRQRIGDLAEVGHQAAGTRQAAVVTVGDRGHQEDRSRGDAPGDRVAVVVQEDQQKRRYE
jgi:hypothetical protein